MYTIKKLTAALLLIGFCFAFGYMGATLAIPSEPAVQPMPQIPEETPQPDPAALLLELDLLSLLNQQIQRITEDTGASIVGISNRRIADRTGTEMEAGSGSGFIFDTDGLIMTNHHVIQGADRIVVLIHDGREYDAEIVGTDSRTDLAVLKIQGDRLTALPLGDSTVLAQGELVFAFGNPLGFDLAGSVTMGVISGTERIIQIEGRRLTLLQTDAAINPGNSGGPLVNVLGQVIGINTLKEFYAGNVYGIPISVEGVGFAIPIDEAKPIIRDLLDQGFVTRPGLGVGVTEITPHLAEANDLPVGVIVGTIVPQGAAYKAGILEGDIIIALNDNPITTFGSLLDAINQHQIGDTVTVTVWREGTEHDFTVILEQLPQQ